MQASPRLKLSRSVRVNVMISDTFGSRRATAASGRQSDDNGRDRAARIVLDPATDHSSNYFARLGQW